MLISTDLFISSFKDYEYMKRLLAKVFLLVILVFTIDKIVGLFMLSCLQNYRIDNRLSKLIHREVNPELLLLGSSRAARNISAEIIEQQTGYKTFNIGYPGSNQEFQETIFKILTNYGIHPKVMILVLDDDAHFTNILPSYYRMDIFYDNLEFSEVYKVVAERDQKNPLLASLFLTYRLNVKKFDVLRYLRNGKRQPGRLTRVSGNGSMLMDGKSVTYDTLKFVSTCNSYRVEDERDVLRKNFENLLSECDEHNIDLILFFPPNYKQPSEQFKNRVIQLAKNKKYIDFSNELREKYYFYDESHLDHNGARTLSFKLASELKKIYPDMMHHELTSYRR